MHSWWLAIGLFFIMEGVFPALFPNKWRRYVRKLSSEPTASIRLMGVIMLLIGGVIILFR